jgi:hypothetical protein
MGLVLILCWCSAVVGRWGGPNILPDNPRFGAFISRFGRREFPVYSATGISLHGVDLSHRFHDERAGIPEKSTKFPVRREKPWNFVALSERAVVQPPDSECRPALLRADRIKPNH